MLVSLGLDFRRARLEVRERFHLEDKDVLRIYEVLASRGVTEAVVTRTCNRLEAYCWFPEAATDSTRLDPAREICRAWVGEDGHKADALMANSKLRHGVDVARHLFRVAAGLESQILGDIHILGQLRRAFLDAIEARSIGSHLHRLFESALRVGKQVKRGTQLMATRSGVGSEAAGRAMARWGGLNGRGCVVLGCGKIGTQAARALSQLGATDLTVVNRSVHRAEKLARELGDGRAASLDALPRILAGAHVVIVATSAQEPVLTAALLQRSRGTTCEPVLVIDVSVPRNVEPAVRKIPHVELLDLDTLHPEAAEVEKSRLAAVPEAEALVEDGVGEFVRWLELKTASHALRPLHEVLSEICRREVSYLTGASPLVERTVDRIVASIMAYPMTALRAASERGEPLDEAAGALRVLFGDARPA